MGRQFRANKAQEAQHTKYTNYDKLLSLRKYFVKLSNSLFCKHLVFTEFLA